MEVSPSLLVRHAIGCVDVISTYRKSLPVLQNSKPRNSTAHNSKSGYELQVPHTFLSRSDRLGSGCTRLKGRSNYLSFATVKDINRHRRRAILTCRTYTEYIRTWSNVQNVQKTSRNLKIYFMCM